MRTRITQDDINTMLCAVERPNLTFSVSYELSWQRIGPRELNVEVGRLEGKIQSVFTTFFTRSAAQLHSNVCVYDGLGLGGFVNDFKNVKADQSERPPLTNLSKETERSEDTKYPRWHKHFVSGCLLRVDTGAIRCPRSATRRSLSLMNDQWNAIFRGRGTNYRLTFVFMTAWA